MKLSVEFNDRAKSGLKRYFISKVIKETLARTNYENAARANFSVSVAAVSEEEIKRLNRTYRRKNRPTDVLSFAEYKNRRELEKSLTEEKKVFLGELVLCYNDIVKYCRENKMGVGEEVARVVSHGTLHLLGFFHGKKMFEIQDKVAKIITDN